MDKQFLTQLAHEVGIWRRENLIDEQQAGSILARYRQEGIVDAARSKFVYTVSIFGALLVGAGAITFFAANWQAIPDWARLALICSSFVASYAAGFRLRFGGTVYPGVGNALILQGALLFGASIFLVAQGFHVRANEPTLLYLWAIGILPLAYLLSSPGAVAIALAAIGIGLGWDLEASHFFTVGSVLPVIAVFLAFGLLLGILGEIHRCDKYRYDLHGPYTALGLFLVSFTLYLLSFRYTWYDWGFAWDQEPWTMASPLIQRLLLLGCGVVFGLILYWRKQRDSNPGTAAALGGAFSGLLALAVGTVFYSKSGIAHGHAFYRDMSYGELFTPESLAFNFFLLLWSLGLIALGHRQHRDNLVNAGIWFFGIQLLTRYFDVFWGLLPNSLVFTGAGIILLVGGALLERTRRRILD